MIGPHKKKRMEDLGELTLATQTSMKKKVPLTKKQTDVLAFIERFFAYKGYMPTLSEIAEFLGAKSHQAASDVVGRLEKKGRILRTRGEHRNISIIEQ